MSARNETFNADAEIVWRLGAELFTDSTQALLELIKNSYDADATRVRVDIVRPGEEEPGRIVITDDGAGMDDQTIINGWLTLSASPKREQKDRGETTDLYDRVPLGDKGLGRLGAQLLGNTLRLRTRPRPVPARRDSQPRVEHDVTIDFADFAHGRLLTDIEPEWFEYDGELPTDWPGRRPWGTVLTITGLRDYGEWLEPYELAKRLSILINPYRQIERFRLSVYVDEVDVDIESVSRSVRDAALGRWRVVYDGERLKVTGRLRKEWFRPKDKDRFDRLQRALLTEDGCDEFVERLNDLGSLRDYTIRRAAAPWLLEAERDIAVPDDIDGLRGSDPGPFEMEIDIVALQLAVARDASLAVFDRQREYRDWIRERATVAVYRDGFVVAEENDLLELGKSFTSGGSYYGLRPQNVMGYVAISGRDNPKLQETASRQAFRQNRELDRFEDLLEFSRISINRVLDEVGRAGTDFARELSERDRGLFGLTADELVDEAQELGERGRAAAATIARAERVLTTILASGAELGIEEAEGRETLEGLAEASRVMETAANLAPVAANLRDRLDEMQDAREELISSAALGLAAEGLAHDLTAIIERLRGRAAKASRHRDLPTDVHSYSTTSVGPRAHCAVSFDI